MYVGNIHQINEEARSLPEGFEKWIRLLASFDFATLSSGRHELGNGSYMNVDETVTALKSDRPFEAHKQYVDIQLVITGNEYIGYQPLSFMSAMIVDHGDRDSYLYEAKNANSDIAIMMTPGTYAIFFPADAHRPLCAVENKPGAVRKIIMKIKLGK